MLPVNRSLEPDLSPCIQDDNLKLKVNAVTEIQSVPGNQCKLRDLRFLFASKARKYSPTRIDIVFSGSLSSRLLIKQDTRK